MRALPEPAFFFEEKIINIEKWKFKKLASAVHALVASGRGLYAFVESNCGQKNHFQITIFSTHNDPLFIYKAILTGEWKPLKLFCEFIRRE